MRSTRNETAEAEQLESSLVARVSASSASKSERTDTDTTPVSSPRGNISALSITRRTLGLTKAEELVLNSMLSDKDAQMETNRSPGFSRVSEVSKRGSKVEVTPQTAVASKGQAQDIKQVTGTTEWKGANILHGAVAKSWYPKEFIQDGEPNAHKVYEGLSKYIQCYRLVSYS